MKRQTIKDPSEASASGEKTNLCVWSSSVGEELIKVLEKHQKLQIALSNCSCSGLFFDLNQKQQMKQNLHLSGDNCSAARKQQFLEPQCEQAL